MAQDRLAFRWWVGIAVNGRRALSPSAIAFLRVALCAVSILGASVMAYSLIPPSSALAKDGGSGQGGNSGSGGGNHDNGGGGHDDGGGRHGGDDGGRSGRGGGEDGGGRDRGDDRSGRWDGERRDRSEDGVVRRFLDSLKSRGRVVWSSAANGSLEVRYADGWSERVKGSTYSLTDPRQRSVITRTARKSDVERLKAAID